MWAEDNSMSTATNIPNYYKSKTVQEKADKYRKIIRLHNNDRSYNLPPSYNRDSVGYIFYLVGLSKKGKSV